MTGIPLRAPSDLPEGVHLEVPVPLDVSEIPAIVQRFADAAATLERCGWDGCEVTSFGGHLIEQFFDPRRQHAHGRVRRQPGEPHALRPRGARSRARRGLGRLHRRLPDGGRPVPDRRAGHGRADRDRAQPRVDRRRSTCSASAAARARRGCRRPTSCPATSCPRASSTSARGAFREARRRPGARGRPERRARDGRRGRGRAASTWSR